MISETAVVTLFILLGLLYFIFWFLTKEFNYWKNKNVPYLEPVIFFGSVKDEVLNRVSWFSFINKCYVNFKNNGFGGMFHGRKPIVCFCDPKLIEKVLVEDFSYFYDRVSKINDYPQGDTLLFSKGEDWRTLRSKLASAFASGKVKRMFQQVNMSTENVLHRIVGDSTLYDDVDVESLTTDFATEVVVSCLCGVRMTDSKEASDIIRALNILYKPSISNNIAAVLVDILPRKFLKFVGLKTTSEEAIDSLSNVIRSILNYRKQSGKRRDDVLQTMMDLKEQEEEEEGVSKDIDRLHSKRPISSLKNLFTGNNTKSNILFTEETITAQILGFMSGGIKPIAVTITFALFEIARNPLIQNKALKDVDSAMTKNKTWSLEALKEMTYLDQVIHETLRLYSFNALLMRCVTRKYTVPGTEVTLDEGMQVFIPFDGLHRDPDFYPNPLQFCPERWEGNNYKTSSTYLPFGHGPRICISIRLAVLTIKLCLARVLRQHRVVVAQKMKLPLVMDEKESFYKVKGGVWLKFDKRET